MRALGLAVAILLPGCLAALDAQDAGPLADVAALASPAWLSGFHNATDVAALQAAIVDRAGGFAKPFTIGKSVGGQDILAVRLTAPGDASGRARVLVDGGIHGNEVFGAESAMHLAAWLAENGATNATARRILETTDVRIVLLLNPDGRVEMRRENDNGVDLNRNFDVDFGNPSPLCRSQAVSPLLPYYYAGPSPLSEPETSALAALMEEFEPQIYVSYHTGRFALIRPWSACNPPQPMPASDDAVLEALESWTRNHTEIQNTGNADETAQRLFPPGAASGSSADWCYLTYRCVALTLEVTMEYGEDGDPLAPALTTFPVMQHLLENAADYAAWRIPADAS